MFPLFFTFLFKTFTWTWRLLASFSELFWFVFKLPVRLCDLVKLQSTCKKQNLLNDLMDLSGNYVQAALPFILSLLQQGLGQRIHQLTHSLAPDPEVVRMFVRDYFKLFC